MRRVLTLVLMVGCYRDADPQPQPLVLHTPGPPEREPLGHEPEPVVSSSAQIASDPLPPPRPVIASGDELVLLGSATAAFGRADSRTYQRICVQDQARISIDGTTRIELTSDRTTVIAGAGIGPRNNAKATIEIAATGAPEIYVLFDNARAPIRAVFSTPNSTVHVGITGKTGLELDGKTKTMVTNGGWGLPPSFPTCNATMDRDPEPSFPGSRAQAKNCAGQGQPSNYTSPQRGDSELHVIGVYEGNKHVNGVIDVHVPARARPVVLALSAYQPTIWRIDASAKLAAVYLYGYEPQRLEGVPKNVRVETVTKAEFVCAYGWEPKQNTGGCYYKKMIASVRKATGLVESSFQGCYAGREFDVPITGKP